MDYYLISVLAFIALLAVLLYRDRKNVERHFGVLFMRRTPRGRVLVDRITRSAPRFWAVMGDFGIATGLMGMVYGIYYMAKQAATTQPSLAFIIPTASSAGTSGTGYVGVPFWYFMIGIAALVIIHEGFHAIQVRLANVRIKSMGLALLAVLPGAFVEPDEKALKKKSTRSQLRVYAAGSFGNFVLAALAGLLLTFVLAPAFSVGAVGFAGYVDSGDGEPYPAQLAELESPIMSLDGIRVESAEQFASVLAGKTPGDIVIVETVDKSYAIKLGAHPEDINRAFLGVAQVHETSVLKEQYRQDGTKAAAINFMLDAIAWIFLLNIGVGIFNMFPIKPLDGGLVMEVLAKRFVPKRADDVMRAAGAFVVVLIFWNFFGGFVV